jgi:hypothetical protein
MNEWKELGGGGEGGRGICPANSWVPRMEEVEKKSRRMRRRRRREGGRKSVELYVSEKK